MAAVGRWMEQRCRCPNNLPIALRNRRDVLAWINMHIRVFVCVCAMSMLRVSTFGYEHMFQLGARGKRANSARCTRAIDPHLPHLVGMMMEIFFLCSCSLLLRKETRVLGQLKLTVSVQHTFRIQFFLDVDASSRANRSKKSQYRLQWCTLTYEIWPTCSLAFFYAFMWSIPCLRMRLRLMKGILLDDLIIRIWIKYYVSYWMATSSTSFYSVAVWWWGTFSFSFHSEFERNKF